MIKLEIIADDAMHFRHELSELYETTLKLGDKVDTSSSTLDAKHNDKLRAEDIRTEGYEAGMRDAKSEKAQETVFRGNTSYTLTSMLAHDTILVCMEPGRAPFPFSPRLVTTFEKAPKAIRDVGESPDHSSYQRELIGTPAQVLGVYGLNKVTMRPMFLVRVDHWTLCPADLANPAREE